MFLRTAFFIEQLVAFSEFESDISSAYLNKNKKKLFSYIDNNHVDQTNTSKKILCIYRFLYIVNINENLKKTYEKKFYFKHV